MKTYYSPMHLGHAPPQEFEAGKLAPAVEIPARAEAVRARIETRKLGPVLPPGEFGSEPILRVHDSGLVALLAEAHDLWTKHYGADAPAAILSTWPARSLRPQPNGTIEAGAAAAATPQLANIAFRQQKLAKMSEAYA